MDFKGICSEIRTELGINKLFSRLAGRFLLPRWSAEILSLVTRRDKDTSSPHYTNYPLAFATLATKKQGKHLPYPPLANSVDIFR
jgi:hypothetical protein